MTMNKHLVAAIMAAGGIVAICLGYNTGISGLVFATTIEMFT